MREPGALRDVGDPGVEEPLLLEDLLGGVDQPGPGAHALAGARPPRPLARIHHRFGHVPSSDSILAGGHDLLLSRPRGREPRFATTVGNWSVVTIPGGAAQTAATTLTARFAV